VVIDIDPEARGEALAGARGWIEGALVQPGCLAYDWTADPHVATRIHVFEEWHGEAALAALDRDAHVLAQIASLPHPVAGSLVEFAHLGIGVGEDDAAAVR